MARGEGIIEHLTVAGWYKEEDERGIFHRLVVSAHGIREPSMFHQTLLSSSSSSSSSSSPSPSTFSLSSLFLRPPSACFPLALGALQQPSPFLPFVHPNFAQVQRGMMTEEAMRGGFKPESALYQQQQRNRGEGGGWSAEKETLSGDGFSVDDLLNLGDYAENDEEAEVVAEVDTKAEAAEAEHLGSGDSNSFSPSSSGSAVSCQPSPPLLAPLSDITLATPDAEELEWLSFITDDTISEFPDCPGVVHFPAPPPKSGKETEALPVAALGAFSLSQDARSLSTEALAPVKAKRTMRSRCATLSIARWNMSCPLPFADSASSTTTSTTTSCSASSPTESSLSDSSDACLIYDHQPMAAGDESFLLYDVPPLPKRQAPKKRGRKPKQPAAAASSSGERRCTHCGAQKTPQWRAGPLGAKTLCNACGVRFKSGRLLPEYRPACSPTFMSSIHSNSHRKVLEMRRKKEAEVVLSAGAAPVFS